LLNKFISSTEVPKIKEVTIGLKYFLKNWSGLETTIWGITLGGKESLNLLTLHFSNSKPKD
jgi:hypothetical protein